MGKVVTVAFYPRCEIATDWKYEFDRSAVETLLEQQCRELAPLGVRLEVVDDPSRTIRVGGYGDLLNSIRLRSPCDGISNLCLGHIIGPSCNCDLLEDIRRGINRVAFAPEMILPEDENRRVCHNCGCGC